MRKGKPLPYPQKNAYGCSLHCLANITNEAKYLRYLEPSVFGEAYYGISVEVENDILKRERAGYYFGSMLLKNAGIGKIYWREFDRYLAPGDGDNVFIYMLGVHLKGGGLLHRIAILAEGRRGNIRYHLIDPLKKSVWEATKRGIYDHYGAFYQIDMLQIKDGVRYIFASVKDKALEHLLPKL